MSVPSRATLDRRNARRRSVSVRPEVYDALLAFARRRGRSLSSIVEDLIVTMEPTP